MHHCSNGGEVVGVNEALVRRRRCGAAWWCFPSASRNPRSVGMWERVVAAVNLVYSVPRSLSRSI